MYLLQERDAILRIVKIWGAIPTRKSVVTGKKHSPTWAFPGDVFVQREAKAGLAGGISWRDRDGEPRSISAICLSVSAIIS